MSKYFVGREGTVIISDAERESLPIIEKLCPGFQIKTLPPKLGFTPQSAEKQGESSGQRGKSRSDAPEVHPLRTLLPNKPVRAKGSLRSWTRCPPPKSL